MRTKNRWTRVKILLETASEAINEVEELREELILRSRTQELLEYEVARLSKEVRRLERTTVTVAQNMYRTRKSA